MDRVLRIQAFPDEVIGPSLRIVLKSNRMRGPASKVHMVDQREMAKSDFRGDILQQPAKIGGAQRCARLLDEFCAAHLRRDTA
jgi:hypothetical protein